MFTLDKGRYSENEKWGGVRRMIKYIVFIIIKSWLPLGLVTIKIAGKET